MELEQAVSAVRDGASLAQVASDFREELIATFGFRPEEVTSETFRDESAAFMRKFARHLGERHAGDQWIGQALRDWIVRCDHYEAWDALLSGFEVEGREALVRRGRMMFPGPLTAHWAES
jgi:hypothetical protein